MRLLICEGPCGKKVTSHSYVEQRPTQNGEFWVVFYRCNDCKTERVYVRRDRKRGSELKGGKP